MTITDTFRAVANSAMPAITVTAIEAKLAKARQDVAGFQAEHGEAALAAVAGTAGAQNRLDGLRHALAQAQGEVSTLDAALIAAKERDAAALRKNRAALQKTQFAALRKHLEARDAAAEALVAAIAETARQWKILVERSAKAQAANPIGGIFPDGALTTEGALLEALELEIARAFAVERVEASYPGLRPIDAAELAPALMGKIKNASAHVVKAIASRQAE